MSGPVRGGAGKSMNRARDRVMRPWLRRSYLRLALAWAECGVTLALAAEDDAASALDDAARDVGTALERLRVARIALQRSHR